MITCISSSANAVQKDCINSTLLPLKQHVQALSESEMKKFRGKILLKKEKA